MDEQLNTGSKFRSELAKELPAWVRRGVIEPQQARKLELMYELKELEGESAKLFSRAIMAFGALLLGGGVMAFVAANWEELPKFLKVIMLFAALLGFHGAGFWLWQKRDHERLGRSLIFAGCLVFGANIGLLAQIFNIQGDTYRGFGAWAVGTIAMAWAIRSASSALLALVLSLTWYVGYTHQHYGPALTDMLVATFPLLVAGLFGSLAVAIPAAHLLGGTILVYFIGMCMAGVHGVRNSAILPPGMTMIAAGWSVMAVGRLLESVARTAVMGPLAQGLGWALISIVGIIMSFTDPWKHVDRTEALLWLFPMLLAAVAGVWAMRQSLLHKPATAAEHTQFILLGGSLGAMCLALIVAVPIISPVLGNLACLGWAGVCLLRGLADASRSAFWSGAILAFLIIVARFFEFDTSLMQKSAAFLACGAGTIYAGIKYEAYLRSKGVTG